MARSSRTGKIRVTHAKKVKRTSTGRAASIRKSPGPTCVPARRRRDREQEVVELNSKCLCGMNKTKSKKV